jgi:hypothetical protein
MYSIDCDRPLKMSEILEVLVGFLIEGFSEQIACKVEVCINFWICAAVDVRDCSMYFSRILDGFSAQIAR